jgi:hypothetical protein
MSVRPFIPRRHLNTYRAKFVLFSDRKRRQWAVVETGADGEESYITVARGRRSEAVYLANLMTRGEARRIKDMDMLARDPLGQAALAMPPETRDLMIKLLNAAQRLTGNAK